MKRFRKSAISRAGIISVISMAIILLSLSFITTTRRKFVVDVAESKVSFSGTGASSQWKMEGNPIISEGNFEASDEELLTISGLSFTLPLNEFKSENPKLELAINEALKQNNYAPIVFKQKYSMILPIMKKVHMVGELSLLNGTYAMPLQISYDLNNNETLRIKSKQTISLSAYGIKLPTNLAGVVDDEIELEIDFLLINKII